MTFFQMPHVILILSKKVSQLMSFSEQKNLATAKKMDRSNICKNSRVMT